MAVRDREVAIVTRRGVLVAVAVVLATLAGRMIDVRSVSGPIKGDEATYIAMAFSLARDGDLRYERGDLERFRTLYGQGPNGIFLKRRYTLGVAGKVPVPTTNSLAYAKALAYPVAAAPFAALGGPGGLLVFNALLLALCGWCGVRFARAVAPGWAGRLLAVAFLGASVVPVYAAWATPELFNFTLVFVAYFLWLYKKVAPPVDAWWGRPSSTVVASVLIGVATFSKATNAALILPIVLDAMASRHLVRAVLLSAASVLATAGLFGLNAVIAGEANYQGAVDASSRRTFQDAFPFDDRGTTFEQQGSVMVTNDADTGRVLADDALRQIPINTAYFFVGRHAGLVPYYLPGVVLLAAWMVRGARAPAWQWGIAVAVGGSIGALVVFFPDSWNGGGGPPGNRYFLSLYPPLFFLVGASGSWLTSTASLAGLAFVGQLVVHPFAASSRPWLNTERRPLNALPIELTLVNDLPCRLNRARCPIPFRAEPAVQLYYMDGRTYDVENDGNWIAGAQATDIIVKTDLPPSRIRFEFSSPIANQVRGSFADRAFATSVPANGTVAVTVSRPTPFRYHQNSVYVLHLETTAGFVPAERDSTSKDTRNLGVFVRPTFEYDPPAPSAR